MNHSVGDCGIVLGYVTVCVEEREENLEHLDLLLLHRQGQLLPAASIVRIVKVASEFLALAVLAPQQTPSDIGGELTSTEEFAAEEVSSGGTWLARLHIIKDNRISFRAKNMK